MKPLSARLETVTSLFRTPPKQIGLPPGTLIHVGTREMEHPLLTRTDFSPSDYQQRSAASLADCLPPAPTDGVSWVHLEGLHDVTLVNELGNLAQLHALAQEDILNTHHQPKYEEYDDAILIILKLLTIDGDHLQIRDEQFCLALSSGRLVTFREQTGELFTMVHQRLAAKNAKFRERGADYLAYALMDTVFDSYYHVLETIGERLDLIEAELIDHPSRDLLQQIHQIRGQLSFVRKTVSPIHDLTRVLIHSESPLIEERTRLYLRDLHDHILHVLANLDSYRDTAKGLIELSLSSMSYRTNEVMQVLTVIAAIFIPLTFIAGVYGMNFAVMPELAWRFGYPFALLLMVACATGMLWYFKRKKWF
ncbi:magnesium/cobalt transporter CorA [Pelovirga terrestris]|uniref:Magnesium transport protein CorA n=1 Tax=Pelovirga terrestris TaxID=2771352 RepID=A0A8J6UIC3_9BACT|nr:magnesium/cobalt transporter CorA [Pelovirga terrestris]MBD1400620.1 magnesium/cobalt transporter CorA [Pelovirga terrestris]